MLYKMCRKGCGVEYAQQRAQIQEDLNLALTLHRREEEKYRRWVQKARASRRLEKKKAKEESGIFNRIAKFFTSLSKKTLKVPSACHSSASSSLSLQPSVDIDGITQEFSDFLKSQKCGRHVLKRCKAFVGSMVHKRDPSADETSQCVKDFYHNLSECLEASMKGSSDHVDRVMDEVEWYLMSCLHDTFFCPEGSDDRNKDLAIQERIRSFHWITAEILSAPVDMNIPVVAKYIGKAISTLNKMDRRHVPKDKLAYITRCSNHIFKAINGTKSGPASADDFFPVLIYVLLKADLPHLQSNIQYITHYCIPSRLITGKDAYFYTNLCGAVAFIENLDGQSLNMSSEDFELYMFGQMSSKSPQSSSVSSSPSGAAVDLLAVQGARRESAIGEASLMECNLIERMDGKADELQGVFDTPSTVPAAAVVSHIDSAYADFVII